MRCCVGRRKKYARQAKITGNFETRKALEQFILRERFETTLPVPLIAEMAGVSIGTCENIIYSDRRKRALLLQKAVRQRLKAHRPKPEALQT